MRYLTQVAVHAGILGLILYAWVHWLPVPSGRPKRHLLMLLLILPLVTAAIPGRASIGFAERMAWFNSARIGAIPLQGGFYVSHLAWIAASLLVVVTIWQEVLPSFRHPRGTTDDVPDELVRQARQRAGWEDCRVSLTPATSIMLATGGWPGHPRLFISTGALTSLRAEELTMALAHEHAHWTGGRWWKSHLLFAVRVLQCYHPVALWAFREYCIEEEIACDALSVADAGRQDLVRLLLRIYRETDRRDVAARSAIRKRVDVLMSGGPQDSSLPSAVLVTAAVGMLLVLPWIV